MEKEKKVSRSGSTSNSCFVSPNEDVELTPFKQRVKKILKSWRPTYRLIFGLRALRDGVKGIFQNKRGAKEHVKSTLSFLSGSEKIMGRPMNVTIEPTNTCNLRCPICETGAGILKRKPEHMSFVNFKVIIDKLAPYTNTLMFYFMGEPFLNKHSYEMIKYAKSTGIPFITTCTNGDMINPEKLVDCGIDEVNFQIGGMTQETHQVYRINSNIERVLTNLKDTIRFRNEKKVKMRLNSGFILMKHNEHETEIFKKKLLEMGADEAIIIDPCVRTIEEGHKFLPTDKKHWQYDVSAFEKGELKPNSLPPNECPWIYYSISIHVNGSVVPCCRDPLGVQVMGNLVTESLDEIWNGEKYVKFRKKLHKDQSQLDICRLCSAYSPSAVK